MAGQMTCSLQGTLLPKNNCFKKGNCNKQRRVVTCGLPKFASDWQDNVSKAAKAAMLSAVFATGISMAPPDTHMLVQPARADDEANLPPSERRRLAVERRKALLSKARENALNRGELSTGDEAQQDANDAPPLAAEEKPQSKPQLPKTPALELPKSTMPDRPKFSIPNRPPPSTPTTPFQAPKEVPKTESPTLPVPAPGPSKPAAPAPATSQPPVTASSSPQSAASPFQGFNFDEYTKAKEPEKPKKNPFASVEPEQKQTAKPQLSKETRAQIAQQAQKPGAKVGKRRGPLPLFLVQLVVTIGTVAALVGSILKFDDLSAGAAKLEKAVIGLVEKTQSQRKSADKSAE